MACGRANPTYGCCKELFSGTVKSQGHAHVFCPLHPLLPMLYVLHNTLAEPPTMQLEIKKIGNSTGVILPKELLARLRLEQGDTITITETPDGFMATRGDPLFGRAMEIARKAMKKYHNTLTELAK